MHNSQILKTYQVYVQKTVLSNWIDTLKMLEDYKAVKIFYFL